ncbi:hypothetical protein ACO0K2_17860 [Undibacterium sp. MH2W]|uniref:hypothetical protein n=1 Tax=Undibacterium sp. MH2W TaxID=3413044 RepID=UPI003BEF9DD5
MIKYFNIFVVVLLVLIGVLDFMLYVVNAKPPTSSWFFESFLAFLGALFYWAFIVKGE